MDIEDWLHQKELENEYKCGFHYGRMECSQEILKYITNNMNIEHVILHLYDTLGINHELHSK